MVVTPYKTEPQNYIYDLTPGKSVFKVLASDLSLIAYTFLCHI